MEVLRKIVRVNFTITIPLGSSKKGRITKREFMKAFDDIIVYGQSHHLKLSVFTLSKKLQKQIIHRFEDNMFELKHKVDNDTKEAEFGIEFVRTFSKNYSL